jgi:hypothetical protein
LEVVIALKGLELIITPMGEALIIEVMVLYISEMRAWKV